MTEKRNGEAIKRLIDISNKTYGPLALKAETELEAYRELLRATKAIADESINKVASIKLCDELLAAIAACESPR